MRRALSITAIPLVLLVAGGLLPRPAIPAASRSIIVWHGDKQRVGHLGDAQDDFNLMGHVESWRDLDRLSYRVNGRTPTPLFFRAYRRLVADGDYTVDVPIGQLRPGENVIRIEAVFRDGQVISKDVTLVRETGTPQSLPLHVRWAGLKHFSEAGQAVDGHWEITPQGLRTRQVGYDRVFLLGTRDWMDYEVSTAVTIHEVKERTSPLSGGNGIGIILRFAGHVTGGPGYFGSGQPKWGYQPFGAIGWLRWMRDKPAGLPQVQFYPGDSDQSENKGEFAVDAGSTYGMRFFLPNFKRRTGRERRHPLPVQGVASGQPGTGTVDLGTLPDQPARFAPGRFRPAGAPCRRHLRRCSSQAGGVAEIAGRHWCSVFRSPVINFPRPPERSLASPPACDLMLIVSATDRAAHLLNLFDELNRCAPPGATSVKTWRTLRYGTGPMINETSRQYTSNDWRCLMPRAHVLILVLALAPALLAQDTPTTSSGVDIKQTYLKLCAGCHGDDARGTQQGPGLAGNPWTRRRSVQNLRNIIRKGIPAAGMPAFDLPSGTIDALADLVKSLNASAAETEVPGDRAAGREFFFGKGQCGSCHMVSGEGSAIGPDLSNIAREMTVDQIRESLLTPDARIAPGYGLVSVQRHDGGNVRGFARTRTSFDITVQDLKGNFHPLSLDQVSRVAEEKRSHMPPVQAGADELQNVVAFLSRLTGVQTGALTSARTSEQGGIDFSRILNPKPGEWLTWNGNLSGNRYSQLSQINRSNVKELSLKWTFSIPLWAQFLPDTPYYRENMRYFGLETVPIVADGIMYVTGPNKVFALDARTGHQIWHYSRPRTAGLVSDPSLGTNRGVAILGDNVFMVTDNAHLIAVNRITGRLVWEVVMWDEPQKYGGTVTPLVVHDMVIAGVSGGDWGIRGFLAAYKGSTGERVWRHWTIPAKGDPGFETWKGTAVATGGGGTWLTGSYDPETDTLFWATGNPWPNSDDSQRAGDNLYTDCVLALDPRTGKLKWYYQFTPHDVRDWDANQPLVLANAKFRGEDRKLLLHANRNGFFYVFDRADGRLLLAEKFIRRLTWASGIGADGRPIRVTERDVSCPDHATNWHATAFSPTTRLYYVMAIERCVTRLSPGSWKKERPPEDPGTRYLRALDIETGKIVWEVPQVGPTEGKRVAGVLGTAGGLLFYGDASGYFVAVDERGGKPLWRIPLNTIIKTSPMTYTVDGEQFVTLAAGSKIMSFALPQ